MEKFCTWEMTAIKFLGVGQVELLFTSDKSLVLINVLYALEIRRNLVCGILN